MGMKTAKKKTAKAVKKRSPASRGPKAGGAPLRLEVGKTYETRNGRRVKIVEFLPHESAIFRFRGRGKVEENHSLAWSATGRVYSNMEHRDDLVREVPRPKGGR